MDAPKRIWVEDGFSDDDDDQWLYGAWDCTRQRGYQTEYILATEHARIVAELTAENGILRTEQHADGEAIGALRDRVAELEERLRDLLAPFEDDPCRYDHHGYCQTHFIEPGDQCCVKLARAALKGDDNG